MAGYGYTYNGYSTYGTPSSDDWTKSSYPSEHVCRPVIIDAEGRKRPIVSFGSNPNTAYYTTKTETVVQHQTRAPLSSEYKYGGRWTDGSHEPLNSFHDRPPIVDEFLNKVQTEASRPRIGPWNGASWRGNTGSYGEYNDFGNNELPKSIGNPYRTDYSDDYYRKQGNTMEPHMIESGGWTRPTHSTWATPPDTPLSKATSNISEAVGLLKEAAKPSYAAPYSRHSEPAYAGTIDSKEAAKRYGSLNFSSRPFTAENHGPKIDSREAARKYGGRAV